MLSFVNYIRSKVHIDEEDLKTVLSNFKQAKYSKKRLLLKTGQIANEYYFILSGGLRFFSGEYANQHTSWAFFSGAFIAEISSLGPRKPTRFNIETMVDTELLVILREDMEKLYKQIPQWQEFGRKVWEEICIQQIDQNLNYQTLSAEETYLKLMENPEFIQRIPVKDLAGILGITPNALSRIRKNIK